MHLLAADSLNEQLPKLVPGVIQLYRKQTEHYYITQVGVALFFIYERERGGREREGEGGEREVCPLYSWVYYF